MPSEVEYDTTLRQVTPASGKGALGKWRAPYRHTVWPLSQVAVRISLGVELEV